MSNVDKLLMALHASLCPTKLEIEIAAEFRRLEALAYKQPWWRFWK